MAISKDNKNHPQFHDDASSYKLRYTSLNEFKESPVRTDDSSVILVVSGKAELELNTYSIFIDRSSVLFLFPSDMIRLKDCSDDFTVEMLTVSKDLMMEAAARLDIKVFIYLNSRRSKKWNDENAIVIRNMFSLLESSYRHLSPSTSRTITILQLRSLLLGINELAQEDLPIDEQNIQNFKRADERIYIFMDLMTKNAFSSRDVQFYANLMSITPKYLNSIVKNTTGLSPKAIIDKYTAMLLKVELKSSSKTIEEISDEFHFPSQSYMGRYFKKVTGQSPTQFRQSLDVNDTHSLSDSIDWSKRLR
jgi:AraC family transcriptional regulator, transcriptional activator of pobA